MDMQFSKAHLQTTITTALRRPVYAVAVTQDDGAPTHLYVARDVHDVWIATDAHPGFRSWWSAPKTHALTRHAAVRAWVAAHR